MRVGIVGAGRIGANCARQLVAGGHDVMLSFSRSPQRLADLAAEIGDGASVGSPQESARFGSVVVLAVPWMTINDVVEQAGPLDGQIVIDTTNQFGPDGFIDLGAHTAARINHDRLVGARYTKSFNTITAEFQRLAAGRSMPERLVQWVAGDDAEAKQIVMDLVVDAGYVGVDFGGVDDCTLMEAPRRHGAVYGEEYRLPEANAVIAAVATGTPIPPTPDYEDERGAST